MNISISQLEGVTVLAVAGSLDTFTSENLTEAILKAIQGGARQLVANLAEAEYVSSAGLRSLLTGMKEARGLGGDLRLAAPRQQIRRVMSVSGFNNIFSIHDDVAAAVASFTPKA